MFCNISVELLRAGGEAMIHGLHAIFHARLQAGSILEVWRKKWTLLPWGKIGDNQYVLLNVQDKIFFTSIAHVENSFDLVSVCTEI